LEATIADDAQLARMAGHIVRRSVDALSQSTNGDQQKLVLHFEH
jgi:hypothetical protein